MIECTLHNLLTSCQYPQVFWIYQMNDYDENILLTRGTKQEMLEDDENNFNLIDHIKVYVDQLQDIYFKINDMIKEQNERDPELGLKMQNALQKLIEGWRP